MCYLLSTWPFPVIRNSYLDRYFYQCFPLFFSKAALEDWFEKLSVVPSQTAGKICKCEAAKLNVISVIGSLLALKMGKRRVTIGLFLKRVPNALYLNVCQSLGNCPWLSVFLFNTTVTVSPEFGWWEWVDIFSVSKPLSTRSPTQYSHCKTNAMV